MKLQMAYDGFFNGRELTAETLKDVAETFGQYGEIPVVKGHDESIYYNDGLPADGWIKKVSVEESEGKTYLLADEVELFEPLKSEMEQGRYKNWSIGISRKVMKDENDEYVYGKWYLFHLAMLGATLPAIPGLRQLSSAKNLDLDFSQKNNSYIFNNKENEQTEKLYFSFTDNKTEVQEMDLEKNKDVVVDDNVETEVKSDESIQAEENQAGYLMSENERLRNENELFAKQVEHFKAKEAELAKARLEEAKEGFSNLAEKQAVHDDLVQKVFSCETQEDYLKVFSEILESIPKVDLSADAVFKEKEENVNFSYDDYNEKQRKGIL